MLEYLGFTRSWYTWERRRQAANKIRERLDRAVASRRWRDMFPNFLVKHPLRVVSDHCPIVLDTEGLMKDKHKLSKYWFKFEAFWTKERECESIIKEAWCKFKDASMEEKMKPTGVQLIQWHNRKFRGMKREINKLTKEIQSYTNQPPSDESI